MELETKLKPICTQDYGAAEANKQYHKDETAPTTRARSPFSKSKSILKEVKNKIQES